MRVRIATQCFGEPVSVHCHLDTFTLFTRCPQTYLYKSYPNFFFQENNGSSLNLIH